MKKQIKIFVAGIFVIIPFAITIYLAWSVGAFLDQLGQRGLDALVLVMHGKGPPIAPDIQIKLWPGVGILAVVAMIYLVGLLTKFWLGRYVLKMVANIFERLPVIKIIYEWVRDLMQLFGSESKRMGRVVLYKMPASDMALLGILTNEQPKGLPAGDKQKVAVYLPLGYMMGGVIVYVPPEQLQEVDISVEEALKLSATAQVTSHPAAATLTPEQQKFLKKV